MSLVFFFQYILSSWLLHIEVKKLYYRNVDPAESKNKLVSILHLNNFKLLLKIRYHARNIWDVFLQIQ